LRLQNYRLILDLQCFAQEKTEKATPKKRQDARKKGQVAKSMEVPSAFILLFSFLCLFLFGGFLGEKLVALFTVPLTEYLLWDVTAANLSVIFSQLILEGLLLVLPFFVIAAAIGIVGNYVQFGFLFSTEPLKMKFSKLNPLEGAKRIFSLRALVEFAKSLLKILVVGCAVYFILWGKRTEILALSHVPLEQMLKFTSATTVMLGLVISLIFIVLAALDYMYQRYEHEKSLRMSKQDIKDEMKKTEGDPLIKGKIREKQRRMALMRMMQEVPKADVVITNPTHYAVALQYDKEKMDAPVVIAKGADYIAQKIKEKAREHGVMTMENRMLARALYEQTEIGQTIPEDLFQAVAEVLAYVYKVKGRI
jgi:flagellar biosynthetic protein FlhB